MLTLADQSFSSVSNFAVGVAVARIAGAAGLGGFAFAYTGWLLLAAMHRALVAEPMTIEGDVRDPGTSAGISSGLGSELLLGFAAASIFALFAAGLLLADQRTFGTAMLTLAPWLPALVVQDYWRWVGFMTRRPDRSLANDSVFNIVQVSGFAVVFVLHLHSISVVFASWGLGGLAGALWGWHQYRARVSLCGGFSLLRSRWGIGKWIASSSLTSWCSTQAYLFITAAFFGPAGLGGLKAAQTIIGGPAGVFIQTGGSIGLPRRQEPTPRGVGEAWLGWQGS